MAGASGERIRVARDGGKRVVQGLSPGKYTARGGSSKGESQESKLGFCSRIRIDGVEREGCVYS